MKRFKMDFGSVRIRLAAALSVVLVLGAAGCKGNDPAVEDLTDSSASSSSGSVTTTPSGCTSGSICDAGFYVSPVVADSNIQYYFHEQSQNPLSTSFTCNVASLLPVPTGSTPGAPEPDDLVCILDINELDLYFNDISLTVNSPKNMCPYTRVSPYVFYVDMPGSVGDVTISVSKDSIGNVVAPLTVTPNDGAVSVNANGNPICAYDYSSNAEVGPNCCAGSYTLISTTSTGQISSSLGTFGGQASNCLVGPAMATQTKDRNGNPNDTIYMTYTSGLNINYAISSPISLGLFTNLYVANFWDPSDIPGLGALDANAVGNYAFPPNDGAATLDKAYPISMLNGTLAANSALVPSQIAPQPYYLFECLDQAFDVLARIRVVIRSWDQVSNWTAYNNPYTNSTNFGYGLHNRQVWRDVIYGWNSFGSGGTPVSDATSPAPVANYGTGYTAPSPATTALRAFTKGEATDTGTPPNIYPHYWLY